MRNLFLVILVWVFPILLFAQDNSIRSGKGDIKSPIDFNAFKNWPTVKRGEISDDGKFIYYYVSDRQPGGTTLVIHSIDKRWIKEVDNASDAKFLENHTELIYKGVNDSLFILNLFDRQLRVIPNVNSYKSIKIRDNCWLTYDIKGKKDGFVLKNLSDNTEHFFSAVKEYFFNEFGNYIGIVQEAPGSKLCIELVDLGDKAMKRERIWESKITSERVFNFSANSLDNQLLFFSEQRGDNQSLLELWYYNKGMDSAINLVKNGNLNLLQGYKLANVKPSFSKDGNCAFLGVLPLLPQNSKRYFTSVDVWSYLDTELQSVQLEKARFQRPLLCALNIKDKSTIVLEEGETIADNINEWLLVKKELGIRSMFESAWNTAARPSYYLVSLRSKERKLLRNDIINSNGLLAFSPGGKWVMYYDFEQKNYFSYEVSTGVLRNVTKGIENNWCNEEKDYPEQMLSWLPTRSTWLKDDKNVLIYDSYDVWLVDPSGSNSPINITNGYGRQTKVKFELVNEGPNFNAISLDGNTALFLTAVNTITKDRGFYKIKPGKGKNPTLLTMQPCVFGLWNGYDSYIHLPKKSKNSNRYLVMRMSAKEAPNYFWTNDFKKFQSLSNIKPQQKYNWLTTELHKWKTGKGSVSDGILYKPEDFDSTKKYPLIIDYYERRSEELNLFIQPGFSQGRINIPWFVSNGYLVFVPDIHYEMGYPGKSAFNTVVSAAKYLSSFSWVDKEHIGIQGHSFGGFETNYIITHTDMFAAACSASGVSDLVSSYCSAARGSYSMYHAERNQGRMGQTLWENTQSYIDNSPILKADKVKTPVLLMNNKNDYVVLFSQGVEFFSALRRLGKKAWMLQYDDGDHELSGTAAEDFTIRLTQFYDHYLKVKPAPIWMTKGVSAKDKGIESGLGFEE